MKFQNIRNLRIQILCFSLLAGFLLSAVFAGGASKAQMQRNIICAIPGNCSHLFKFNNFLSAQTDKLKGSDNLSLIPLLEWQSNDVNATGSDGTPYIGITFGIKNWDVFSDAMFTSAPELPACGLNVDSSRTWLEIYDHKTKKRIYGFCAMTKAEEMKALSFLVRRENLPECVYITLNDRKTKKALKSNWINFFGESDHHCAEEPVTATK